MKKLQMICAAMCLLAAQLGQVERAAAQSPLFAVQLSQGIANLSSEQSEAGELKAVAERNAQPSAFGLSANLGSHCALSGCFGSSCGLSGCLVSHCIGSLCIWSDCQISLCLVSGCQCQTALAPDENQKVLLAASPLENGNGYRISVARTANYSVTYLDAKAQVSEVKVGLNAGVVEVVAVPKGCKLVGVNFAS